MIVCSCNVLSDTQILATMRASDGPRPRTPAQAYRCLGCAPRCGRCVSTVRALLARAHLEDCAVGCAVCPGAHPTRADDHADAFDPPFLLAAE